MNFSCTYVGLIGIVLYTYILLDYGCNCNHIKYIVTFFRMHCTEGKSCTKAWCSTAAVEVHSLHWTSEKSGGVRGRVLCGILDIRIFLWSMRQSVVRHTGHQKTFVEYGAECCAAYLSNDDGHTPRAGSYPPFPPFLCALPRWR